MALAMALAGAGSWHRDGYKDKYEQWICFSLHYCNLHLCNLQFCNLSLCKFTIKWKPHLLYLGV